MTPVALLLIAALGQPSQQPVTTDTTIRVRAGMRLNVNLGQGSIVVRVWERQEVRIVTTRPSEVELQIDTGPAALTLRSRTRGKPAGIPKYQITVPRTMDLNLGRGDVDVDVAGTEGEVIATVRDGTISIDGGRGLIALQTAHGAITVAHALGRISARTLNSDIRIIDSSGDIEVEGSDGNVVLERIDATFVDVSTVDGSIVYEGPLKPEGHYSFATHDQGVRLSIPATSSATISVATVTGQVKSDFPFASRQDIGKGRFSFVVGNGAALVSLASFEGLVEVRRLGPDRH